MKKIVTVLVVLAMSIGICSYLFFKPKQQSSLIRVAIFAPAIHPAMDEIAHGFETTLQSQSISSYTFDTYNANGNKTLLRAQAEEIVYNNYDLIFTIGTVCSHTIAELTKKKQSKTPVVFTAIDDPVKLGLVASLSSSGNNLTGTIIQDDFNQQLDSFMAIKPSTKQMLLVYDPAGGMGQEGVLEKFADAAVAHNITLSTVQVYSTQEIQQKAVPMLALVDSVFVYTDHTVVSGIDTLINACNKYHVTLFASDLNSGDKGAAVAYGVQEAEHGIQAALKAHLILVEKQVPSAIPISPIEKRKIKINSSTMAQQGLALTAQEIETITHNGGIII